MKILYAIQGTGNGHMCRAAEVLPHFMRHARVEVLVSGTQVDVALPFSVRHRCTGLGLVVDRKGGVDRWATLRAAFQGDFIGEVKRLQVEDYDLVVNDFEPVSAWAARWRNVPCISLSHQAAVLNDMAPQPLVAHRAGMAILRHFAPARKAFGFHFARYDQNIFTPVIRRAVRECRIQDHGHITVYLPSYSDKAVIEVLSKIGGTGWEVFSKRARRAYAYGNVRVSPVQDDQFVRSMANSSGVLCGAGFETPAEALYLGKRLLVTPMAGQYEQYCNAAALAKLGVPSIPRLHPENLEALTAWLKSGPRIPVNYPDNARSVVDEVLSAFCKMVGQPGDQGEASPMGMFAGHVGFTAQLLDSGNMAGSAGDGPTRC